MAFRPGPKRPQKEIIHRVIHWVWIKNILPGDKCLFMISEKERQIKRFRRQFSTKTGQNVSAENRGNSTGFTPHILIRRAGGFGLGIFFFLIIARAAGRILWAKSFGKMGPKVLGRAFSWRAQGGFRISPLRALQTTRNPPETGCSTGACGPPRRNRLPPGRNRSDKVRRIFPLLKRAMRVWAAAQRAPGSARPFEGG